MKWQAFLVAALCCSLISSAQTKAVTESGDEVILYTDGTWKYTAKDTASEIALNPKKFEKNAASTFRLKSAKFLGLGLYIDPKKWQFGKGENNEDAEFEMQLKGGDLYAMVIAEMIEIPLESLREIALENARKAAPDITLVKQEYRMVNGTKVLFMRMDGSTKGIKISFSGYYYSTPKGTVQFVAYTSQGLLGKFNSDIDALLNGMVITE